MFLCIMYLCVFVMAVCPIVDVLRYSRSEHKPLNYFLSTLLQRNLRFMQYPFSYHGLYSQLHHGHFSQYCFLFIKFHFTQLSKKNFLYQNKKKLLKKVKILFYYMNGIGWCHLIIYDFRSRLNQTKSGSFNCKHQSYYVEYIKYVLLPTLLKMRRIDTRIKCFIL